MKNIFLFLFLIIGITFAATNTYLTKDHAAVVQSEKLNSGLRQWSYTPTTALSFAIGDTIFLIMSDTVERIGYTYDRLDANNGLFADSVITYIKVQGDMAADVDTLSVYFQSADREIDSYWSAYAEQKVGVLYEDTVSIRRIAQEYIPGTIWRAYITTKAATDTCNVVSIRRHLKYVFP